MGEWESAGATSRRSRVLALAAVVVAALVAGAVVVGRWARAPAPDLRVERATEDGAPTTTPTDVVWPRPQPGLWRFMPDAPLTPRVGHAMVWAGDAVFVWGGFDVVGLPLTDGGLFDPATGTWEVLPAFDGGDATASYVAWSGADVVVVSTDATHVFDPRRGAWEAFPSPPLPEGHVLTDQVVGTGDGVIAASRPGRGAAAPRPALFALERPGRTWRRLADPPVPMEDGDVVLTDGDRAVVLTRGSTGRPPDGAELDLRRRGARWRDVAAPPGLAARPLVRLLGGMADDGAVLVGVGLPGAPGYAAVHDGRAWTRTDPPPLPASPQVDGLWVGDGLIVWNRLTGAGAQLGLRSARWTRFAHSPVADGAPRPAAWTGSTVVTWGGFDPAGAVYRVR